MAFRREEYHPDWESISRFVRFERADGCCEGCGAGHNRIIQRGKGSAFRYATGCERLRVAYVMTFTRLDGKPFTEWRALAYCGLTKVELATAHQDHNRENNALENLIALCQRCHLELDDKQHVRSRAYGRRHERVEQLQLFTKPMSNK